VLVYLFLHVLRLLAGIILVVWLVMHPQDRDNRWNCCIINRYGAASLDGCSRAVSVSPVEIEVIPLHRKIGTPITLISLCPKILKLLKIIFVPVILPLVIELSS